LAGDDIIRPLSDAADTIAGFAGDDLLILRNGDTGVGGEGDDTFQIDTLYLPAGHEVISVADFSHKNDVIDFSPVDANVYEDGDQAFKFIGKKDLPTDSDPTGLLRAEVTSDGVTLFGSTDAAADVEITVFVDDVRHIIGHDLVL
jgi:hypothetical protein